MVFTGMLHYPYYKLPVKKTITMADKKVQVLPTAQTQDVDVLEKARGLWEKFNMPILYAGGAILVLVIGFFVYKNYVKQPKEDKAADLIYPAEAIFDVMSNPQGPGFNTDSINLVLKGGDGVTGFLKIANDYGSTDAGNLAKYYAGTCYLHLKDFGNAIKYLKDFSTKATQIKSRAYIMLGDAYSEKQDNDDALDYYKKAAGVNDKDDFMTSEALFREGQFAESIGNKDVAIDCYQKIRDNYPKTQYAGDMDKYLAALGVYK
jgi:tetratricopeptide (TPR) repeat protein